MSSEQTTLGPFQLGPNHTPELGIYQGDSKELSSSIPDQSIEMIFSDPEYGKPEDYTWLAELGTRILIPGGVCLTWAGIGELDKIFPAMEALDYRWTLASILPNGKPSGFAQYKMFTNWRCLLWYENGKSKARNYFSDVLMETDNHYTGRKGWGKSIVTTNKWLAAFSPKMVFDPFCGGGTVPVCCLQQGISYLGFDIDPKMVRLSRNRIRQTQPPLFTFEPQQTQLDLG